MGSSGSWLPRLVLGVLLLLAVQGGQCEHEPTESECRPYIQKALKEHHIEEDIEESTIENVSIEQEENPPTDDLAESTEDSKAQESTDDATEEGGSAEVEGERTEGQVDEESDGSDDDKTEEQNDTAEAGESQEDGESIADTDTNEETDDGDVNADTQETEEGQEPTETSDETENAAGSTETTEGSQDEDTDEGEAADDTQEQEGSQEGDTAEETEAESVEGDEEQGTEGEESEGGSQEGDTAEDQEETTEDEKEVSDDQEVTTEGSGEETDGSQEGDTGEAPEETQEGETAEAEDEGSQEGDTTEGQDETQEADDTAEEAEASEPNADEDASQDGDTAEVEGSQEGDTTEEPAEETAEETEEGSGEGASVEEEQKTSGEGDDGPSEEGSGDEGDSTSKSAEEAVEAEAEGEAEADAEATEESDTEEASAEGEGEEVPEEDLTQETVIPANLRSHDHIVQILKLDEGSVETESALSKTIDNTLKTLKSLYDNAIKPLEILYKYRDLSNRHFGDPEIFSKPLILFMGPWSGGKSSTINYLLDNEFNEMSLRTGAEPSPAYFNILMYGDEPEILDGTQLAADWTFSGLQKFGQSLLDRLRGVRLPNRLLEKVNIVEIPGILEIRKQVQRLFPFNDACQWFIDRADIIFLVYDPAKLDVGPETEAILDQLKGREYQTRIILNKADQVKPEELMRVQGTLIWNISPLMSSQEPPVMYTTSLWSLPYEPGAPARLLLAQERAFLRDLREAIDKRVENKIASARRFAVRVRNHAKMVDCYLTTYYNHKTFFGNKKKISDDIIENPQKYHIYEGLSTLTNISRYDLPDPEMYRDFFRINPLYDFTKLSDTCTYFRGCPINKLDIAIAYDLPEVVGKYKKAVEASKSNS